MGREVNPRNTHSISTSTKQPRLHLKGQLLILWLEYLEYKCCKVSLDKDDCTSPLQFGNSLKKLYFLTEKSKKLTKHKELSSILLLTSRMDLTFFW